MGQYPALVLNADFTPLSAHPLSVWGFERTLRNVMKDRVIELAHHDAVIRSQFIEYIPPSVVALKSYVKNKKRVAFSRMNIFLRDDFTCQYCGSRFMPDQLTFDHVIPRSKGGGTNFENIVSACEPCNSRKGNSCDMSPLRAPRTPTAYELLKATPPNVTLHKTWHDWLYWDSDMDQE